ncbi:MAG: hypothetical protein HOP02_13810, partial [Methylococcaceae bacterium]|nr:hypothetical protein [Methylococcaceae bacterium]
MFEAARIGDEISHTQAFAGFILGAIVGVLFLAAAAALMFVTGGLAVFLICMLASGLLAGLAPHMPAIGEAIGSMFKTTTGTITTGSFNVFTNTRNSAHVQRSIVACSKDYPVQMVAEGSTNVFINNCAAARIDDSITCGAKISSGSENVFIGGGRKPYLPIQSEVPEYLKSLVGKLFYYLEKATMFLGLSKLAMGLTKCILTNGFKAAIIASLKAIAPCAGKFVAGLAAGMAGNAAGNWLGGQATSIAGGQVGNPVQVSTGNKLLLADEETDIELISPLPIIVARFYNSSLDDRSTLGLGWRLPWETSLTIKLDSILYADGQGREITLPKVPKGEKLFIPFEQFFLSHLNDGRWVITGLDEVHYLFTAQEPKTHTPPEIIQNSDNLQIQEDQADKENTVTFLLTHIEDKLKNYIKFERNAEGLVTNISDSVAQELNLHYQPYTHKGQSVSRLQRIELTAGGKPGDLVHYDYNASAQLISVSNSLKEVTRRFAWGGAGAEQGLMIEHSHMTGLSCFYRWQIIDAAPRVVEHHTNDGEHYLFSYDFTNKQCHVKDLSIPEQPAEAHWQWDEFKQITHCKHFDGRLYQMDYDDDNNLIALHLPSDDKPRIAHFAYDELGRVISETSPEGLTTQRDFAPESLRIQKETLANGAIWLNLYEPTTGVLLQTEDPLGAKTEYTWETPFGPSAIKNALGKSTGLNWSNRGQLLSYTDCSGKAEHYRYDENGNLNALTDALGQTTTYQLDALSRLQSITHPDGSAEQLTWNQQGLLASHTNPAGHSQRWHYTTRGQIQQHQDAAGKITQARYNTRQQLAEVIKGTARHRFAWDVVGRLVAERHPDNIEQRYHYSPQGWLSQRDTLGSPTVASSPAQPVKRSRYYQYDADGRLLSQENQTATLQYTYTPLGLLHTATRTPTAAGMALGLGIHNLRFSYDKLGRIVQEVGNNGELNYTWDALSNLQTLTLPQGQQLNYQRYGSGHVHGLRFNDLDIVNFERDDLHREIQRSQGQLSSYSNYDKLGRLSQQRVAFGSATNAGKPVIGRHYRYNSAFELEQINDLTRGTQEFTYDPAGRLLASNRNGQNERFHWDDADNLLSSAQTTAATNATGKGGGIQGNRLLSWLFNRAGVTIAISNQYDEFGRLTLKQHSNPEHIQQLTWDDEDQLVSVSDANGITRFEYDPLGRRIAKHHQPKDHAAQRQKAGHSTHFVWEGMRLLQELDSESQRIRSWLYDPAQNTGYTPLACIDQQQDNLVGSATVYYAQTDQIGTIQELTNAQGQIAWSANYSAWGQRQGQAAIAIEQQAPTATDCQLRF